MQLWASESEALLIGTRLSPHEQEQQESQTLTQSELAWQAFEPEGRVSEAELAVAQVGGGVVLPVVLPVVDEAATVTPVVLSVPFATTNWHVPLVEPCAVATQVGVPARSKSSHAPQVGVAQQVE